MISNWSLNTLTSTVALELTMTERLESAWGQIGVMAKTCAAGTDNRPAGGKGIGRRTGRRTDDQAVAAITGQRLAVHAHLQFDHPRNGAVADDDVVERGGMDRFALAPRRWPPRAGGAR